MIIKYPLGSPYYSTPQLSWRMGRYEHRPIPYTTTDTEFTITPAFNNRPDKLADHLYGNPAYWWVFKNRNPNLIRHPLWDFATGLTIMVPSNDALRYFGL